MRITQCLKGQALRGLLFLTITMSACLELPENEILPEIEVGELALSFNKNVLLEEVNTLRKNGCACGDQFMPAVKPLSWNNLLAKAAQNHSEDMFQNNFFNHVGSDNSTLDIRVNQMGYQWRLLGENIARGNFDEKAVVRAWKESPGHCQLMMDADFLEFGVGRKENLWTMVLAK
ncbi:CAP domain-containing protein [Cecembia lonarensis]|uniref:SCP domain-containing protein n=1 Tax=Cecembia lonarensis (strain CCUG 58316 / KCTC 22772 / LW9) TaxID=1225176 RepID=K1L0I7_CECL9|nr:CAP domain-containing protein [Cecembia lonarensis]EKB48251.1 putative protein, YkwD family [Cecembia lonarensis LW9]